MFKPEKPSLPAHPRAPAIAFLLGDRPKALGSNHVLAS
jgi:hypothetical protein